MISGRRVVVAFALQALACGRIAPDDDAKPVGSGAPYPAGSQTPPTQSTTTPPPPPPPASHCTSGVRDGDETDIDCGGASCAKCGDERTCAGDADCRGKRCSSAGVCRSVVVDIAAGALHTCALYAGGSVRCWGDSGRGQLGLGTRTPRGHTTATIPSALPFVDLGKKRFATALSVGAAATCVVIESGVPMCWGANVGATGPGTNADRGIYPEQMGDAIPTIDLGTGRTVRSMASGSDYWCALLDDATIKCWGNGFNGALGDGGFVPYDAMGDQRPPVKLGYQRTATAVATGAHHTCAVLDDLSMKCWGDNGAGQAGIGQPLVTGNQANDMGEFLPRVRLGTGRTVKQVALGFGHSCAILDDDSLKCWGYNGTGALGLGDTANRGRDLSQMGDALPAVDLGPGRKAKLVASSSAATHTCALLDDQSVRCWGWNVSGQLGQGDTVDRAVSPSDVPGLVPAVALGGAVTKLAVGGRHACAMLQSGAVKCWGYNEHGELGLGDTESRGDGPSEMGAALPEVSLVAP